MKIFFWKRAEPSGSQIKNVIVESLGLQQTKDGKAKISVWVGSELLPWWQCCCYFDYTTINCVQLTDDQNNSFVTKIPGTIRTAPVLVVLNCLYSIFYSPGSYRWPFGVLYGRPPRNFKYQRQKPGIRDWSLDDKKQMSKGAVLSVAFCYPWRKLKNYPTTYNASECQLRWLLYIWG